MNRAVFCLSVFAILGFAVGQQTISPGKAADASYLDYRMATTEPIYGLTKVKSLVQHGPLNGSQYSALSTLEKFTHAMIDPELSGQNCSMMPFVEGGREMISGELPAMNGVIGPTAWSQRQLAFLKDNRKKVIELIRDTIHSHGHVGLNLKQAIVEIDAYNLIPDVIEAYDHEKRDLDLLTTLMVLMKDAKYRPFLNLREARALYGPKSEYKSSLKATYSNRNLIIQEATMFSKSGTA